MARLRISENPSTRAGSVASSLYRDPSVPLQHRHSSPSSDKENRDSRNRSKPAVMDSAQSAKRRRLSDRDGSTRYESSSVASEDELEARQDGEPLGRANEERDAYDPFQDISERRQLRKNFREMDQQMQDQRQEWMAPESHALEGFLHHQNQIYHNVKQTSEATMDSRMLVNAGEITFKRTKNLNVGDHAQGVDVEEFIGKCISFMRAGGDSDMAATQRRRRAAEAEEDDEADLNQGDALDWAFLGAQACLPFNGRPPTTSFLLGPLSVQRPPRPLRVRRERLARAAPVEAVQAKELQADELGRAEDSSVTSVCRKVMECFRRAHAAGIEYVEKFWEDHPEEEDAREAEEEAEFRRRNVIMSDGGLSLFKFAFHPHSFGQTVENIFYLSFLIKDDFIQLKEDGDGLPSLHAVDDDVRNSTTRVKGQKYQAVFELDHNIWRDAVEANDIDKPMIPDRAVDPTTTQIGTSGWYG